MASTTGAIRFNTEDLAHHITMVVKFKQMREWKLRMVIGVWLMRLAALIMWVNIKVEDLE